MADTAYVPIREYEKKKINLRNYLHDLDRKCKIFVGPNTKFAYPSSNPYKKFSDVDDFKKREMKLSIEKNYLVKREVCPFNPPIEKNIDSQGRFYTKIRNADDCKEVNGIWDPVSLNRINKFDRGVCWVDQANKICSQQVHSPDVLRPYAAKFQKGFKETLSQEANRCGKVDSCKWKQQTAFTYDCVPDKKVIQEEITVVPPETMPVADFEAFLENWYVKNIPVKAPETMKLNGKGNRCTGLDDEDNIDILNLPPPPPLLEKPLDYIDFRRLDPSKKKDEIMLRKVFKTDERYAEFLGYWKKKDHNELERYYHAIEIGLLEFDYKINTDNTGKSNDKDKGKEKKMVLSVPQSIVNMVLKNWTNKKATNRGLLAWHSTGSGKTATATGVIDAFWDDSRRIIFASSLDAIASNPDWKFHWLAKTFFHRFKDLDLPVIKEMFMKRGISFYSFAKLSNRVKKAEELKKLKKNEEIPNDNDYVDLDRCVLIIDEVHNLFRPLATQQKQHEYLEGELVNPKKHPNTKIVILTATPGDNIPDVIKLLNIVRPADLPVIKAPNINKIEELKTFKNQIRGMISYLDMSNDTTRFPIVKDSEQPVKYPMSETQFAKYIEAYKTVSAIQKDYKKLSKQNMVYKYWAPARKYANTLFNFEKDMALHDFSAKMPGLFENLKKYSDEKHYIYSAFYTSHGYGGQGVIAISKELEKIGYKRLSVEEAKKYNKSNKLPPPEKRYILATINELGDHPGNNMGEFLKIYNNSENKDGKLIHVMLASQGFNEGLDLKGVRHIHFFEPLITMASDKQTLGRAARSCSHEDLDRNKGEWVVNIHRYMSDRPSIKIDMSGESIEELNAKLKESDNAKEKIAKLKLAVKETKTKGQTKNANIKGFIEETKRDIENISKTVLSTADIKDIKQKIKRMKEAKAASDIPMIEEQIFKESRERMKELMVVYQCMKAAAIDCRVLKDFHSKTGHDVECEF